MAQAVETAETEPENLMESVGKFVPQLQRQYHRGVNLDLTRGNADGVFERQVIAVTEQLFEKATDSIEHGMVKSSSDVDKNSWLQWCLELIATEKDALLEYAIKFNRSSCALSNFPKEHLPSGEYLAGVIAHVERQWQTWSSNLLERFLPKSSLAS